MKTTAVIKTKDVEIHNHEELLNQSKGRCQQLEEDYAKSKEKTAADIVRRMSLLVKMHDSVGVCIG